MIMTDTLATEGFRLLSGSEIDYISGGRVPRLQSGYTHTTITSTGWGTAAVALGAGGGISVITASVQTNAPGFVVVTATAQG
jgi:hypothetical protein